MGKCGLTLLLALLFLSSGSQAVSAESRKKIYGVSNRWLLSWGKSYDFDVRLLPSFGGSLLVLKSPPAGVASPPMIWVAATKTKRESWAQTTRDIRKLRPQERFQDLGCKTLPGGLRRCEFLRGSKGEGFQIAEAMIYASRSEVLHLRAESNQPGSSARDLLRSLEARAR